MWPVAPRAVSSVAARLTASCLAQDETADESEEPPAAAMG